MESPRVGWHNGQPVVLDLLDRPHSVADLARAVAALEAQRAALTATATVLDAAIAQRRTWMAELARTDAPHAA